MKTTRGWLPFHERDQFDWTYCHFSKGWAQVDTTQDAPYYGIWANPIQLKIVHFSEGDVKIEEYERPEEFKAGMEKLHEWAVDGGYWKGLDHMQQDDIEQGFRRLGLEPLFYPQEESTCGA